MIVFKDLSYCGSATAKVEFGTFHILTIVCGVLLVCLGQARAQEEYRLRCRPPAKFMAGSCVPQCYAGYEDRGRWCEERRGGGGGGP